MTSLTHRGGFDMLGMAMVREGRSRDVSRLEGRPGLHCPCVAQISVSGGGLWPPGVQPSRCT